MRTYRSSTGPFSERPFFKPTEIERICTDALREVGLYPTKLEPVRIERFIEKHFKVTPVYESLPDGVLGYTQFGPQGVEAVVVARSLSEDDSKVSRRRINTTLGHEAGHGLLHAHLFALAAENLGSLFGGELEGNGHQIMCRDGAKGRWHEVQANMVMGAILLPRPLVLQAVAPLLVARGALGENRLEDTNRSVAIRQVSDVFDVNPIVAQIRLGEMFPPGKTGQLSL
jgi:hypothetical protein